MKQNLFSKDAESRKYLNWSRFRRVVWITSRVHDGRVRTLSVFGLKSCKPARNKVPDRNSLTD